MRTTKTRHLTRSVIQRSQFESMGSNRVDKCQENGWEIEVCQRNVGLTLRRTQFAVTIRHLVTAHEEYLSGFSDCQQAQRAARDRVELLARRPELLRRGGKRRPKVLPDEETWQREIVKRIPNIPQPPTSPSQQDPPANKIQNPKQRSVALPQAERRLGHG